jgi:hypothetical protein
MKRKDVLKVVMVDGQGKEVQIGSTVRVGPPAKFDDYPEPFSGVVLGTMEERGVVLVQSEKGDQHVVEATSVSLLAKAEDIWDDPDDDDILDRMAGRVAEKALAGIEA